MQEFKWLPNPRSRTPVCLGFDGSENNDWTAIRGETMDGFQFTPRYGDDERPTIWKPEEWGGRIPREEVAAAVDELFDRYEVVRFYCDPQDWRSEIGDWSVKYGSDHVFEWPTNMINRMFEALKRFLTDLHTGRISHDGCRITNEAFLNARKAAKPGQKYVLAKQSEHQKIDPAMASVLAHEAAMDAHASGYTQQEPTSIIIFGGRNGSHKGRNRAYRRT
mgnify:FL=1